MSDATSSDDDGDNADDARAAPDDPAFAALLARLATTPAPARALLAPGMHVGPFVVEELLGRGGMGEVWRALDTRLQRAVALKVLRPSTHEARLFDEARAAAAVHHPRVATVYEVGAADAPAGRVGFIALELVPGVTLRARLRGGPLPVREVLGVALDVAEGLAAVHARGLVHRDVKPDNLALDEGGRVKLLDFGIAVPAGAGAEQWGTPRYLAPEQRAGDPVDARTDVFALGVTLLELLTGAAPFDDDGALVPELAGDPVARARALPGAPSAVLELLARCVARDRARRPPDAAALAHALTPLVHRRPSARERAAPWITLGAALTLTTAFLASIARVEDVVALDLPPALASAPVVSDDARVRARFRFAADALLAGDGATAASALDEVVHAEPRAAWPWALLAASGDPQRAGRTHAEAVAAVRTLADTGTREGRAARALIELVDAERLGRTQRVDPASAAAGAARAALDEAGTDAFAAVLLASLVPWQHDVQEQLDRIDAALSRDARVARLWVARADALLGAGRALDAAAAARAGLERVPGNAALEHALWRARLAQGEVDPVARALDDRVRARPDDVDARLLLLDVAAAKGDRAALWAQAAALLDGPSARARVARAVAAHARAAPERANDAHVRALEERALQALEHAGYTAMVAEARRTDVE